MSLTITIIASWGIWQCSDHRLTDPHTGKIIQDDSTKHVLCRFPDGGALLAYSGIGRVNDVQISDWVRETLRGESRMLDETLIYLREQATNSIGPLVNGRYHHMFSIGAFIQRHPWIVQIRNFHSTRPGEIGPPAREFITAAMEIKGRPLVFISGARDALSSDVTNTLAQIAAKRPNNLEDFHGLLAKYNRLASSHKQLGRLISPDCATSFMPPEAEPISVKLHSAEGKEAKDITLPTLLFGIDMTDTTALLSQRLKAMSEIGVDTEQDFDFLFREAAERGVHPINRLSKQDRRNSKS